MTGLKDKLTEFCLDTAKSLPEFYEEFDDEKEHSIRARLNENVGKCFKRLARGIYVATKGGATAVIIEGDAWKSMELLEDSSVDTIITDSPYSCLNKHLATGTTRKKSGSWSFKTADIDLALLKEMHRVLKPGGHFFSFMPPDGSDTLDYTSEFIELARSLFQFNKRAVWDKVCIGMGYNLRNRHEQILFFSKGKRRKPCDLSIPDVLAYKRIAAHHRIHEAEKPVELLRAILRFSCVSGDVALDMFAGSLSLAEAGLAEGVHTISVEVDGGMVKTSLLRRGLTIWRTKDETKRRNGYHRTRHRTHKNTRQLLRQQLTNSQSGTHRKPCLHEDRRDP